MGAICSYFRKPSKVEESESHFIVTREENIFFTKNCHKKALLIGVNYDDNAYSNDDLRGCENDTQRIKKFLIDKLSFEEEDITVLLTESATRETIEIELLKLVDFAQFYEDSDIFLHYSGHGTFVSSNTESDNQIEAICPSDYVKSGLIFDHWIKDYVINMLPADCRMFCLIDCCHSGTCCNLCYEYRSENNLTKRLEDNSLCQASVVKISGCKDDQVSFDYYNSHREEFNGALTNAFIETFDEYYTFKDHLHQIRSYLQNRFTQIPNLTISHPKLVINYLM